VLDERHEGEVDVGGFGVFESVHLEQDRYACCDLAPNGFGDWGEWSGRDGAVSGGGHAVEFLPLRVEGTP
jgi:hypothetical protein